MQFPQHGSEVARVAIHESGGRIFIINDKDCELLTFTDWGGEQPVRVCTFAVSLVA